MILICKNLAFEKGKGIFFNTKILMFYWKSKAWWTQGVELIPWTTESAECIRVHGQFVEGSEETKASLLPSHNILGISFVIFLCVFCEHKLLDTYIVLLYRVTQKHAMRITLQLACALCTPLCYPPCSPALAPAHLTLGIRRHMKRGSFPRSPKPWLPLFPRKSGDKRTFLFSMIHADPKMLLSSSPLSWQVFIMHNAFTGVFKKPSVRS